MRPPGSLNWLEIEHFGDVTIATVAMARIVEQHEIQGFERELHELANEVGPHSLLLNFKGVEKLSTELLGKLITVRRLLQVRGGKLELCSLRRGLREIFKSLNLARVLTVYADEHEALQESRGRRDPTS